MCVNQCTFGTHYYDDEDDEVRSREGNCVGCHRCVLFCPTQALTISHNPLDYRENYNWRPEVIEDIIKHSETGGVLFTRVGDNKSQRIYWDQLVLNASQVTNPSIDPLCEPMELTTYLGRKPDQLELNADSLNGKKWVLVIGGTAQDFLGEYMAGDILILLGLNLSEDGYHKARFIGTGMHGGVIYLGGGLESNQLGKEVDVAELDGEDWEFLKDSVNEFAAYFDYDAEVILKRRFVKLFPR